jgi:hypothetical protein
MDAVDQHREGEVFYCRFSFPFRFLNGIGATFYGSLHVGYGVCLACHGSTWSFLSVRLGCFFDQQAVSGTRVLSTLCCLFSCCVESLTFEPLNVPIG